MLYRMTTTDTTAVAPRAVAAHVLLHLRASKAARACLAADVADGLAVPQNPTLGVVARAYGISVGYVSRARRLTPEQRQAVRQGKRPLILPRAPSAPPVLPAPSEWSTVPTAPLASPMTVGARERLQEIVHEIGLDATLELLAATEKVAA
jgi:hypothetical protein